MGEENEIENREEERMDGCVVEREMEEEWLVEWKNGERGRCRVSYSKVERKGE